MTGANRDEDNVVCLIPASPHRPSRASAVRSTLVTSGLVALRARGLYETYLAALPPVHRESVSSLVAGAWLPADFMLAHYAACDALRLPADEIRAIGRSVGDRLNDSVFQALRRLATGAGITPWAVVPHYGRFWTRAFEGGAVRITKLGPKDASIAISQVPFSRSPYFRGTFCAIHEVALGLFARQFYARLLTTTFADDGFAIRLSWV